MRCFGSNMFSVMFCVLSSNKVVAGLEDLLFYTITQGEDNISVTRFLAVSYTNNHRMHVCVI